jgi:serine/threonine protein kinase
MEIRFLNKAGVPRAEVLAHQEIERVFNASPYSKPWRGYASFRLARAGTGAGDDDFDLVLVTGGQILVVELKNWRGERLSAQGGHWFLDGRDMGTSPAVVANLKAKKLASAMTRELSRSKTPFVASIVVIQNGVRILDLSDDSAAQNQSVMSLNDFLKLSDERAYRRVFPRSSNVNPLLHLVAYDSFFRGRDFRPRDFVCHGFKPDPDPIWIHPRELYSEYRAESVDSRKQLALMRQWDFDTLGTALIGEGERAFIALREQRIFDLVKEANPELSLAMLQPIVRHEERDVTTDFRELFKLPTKLVRVSEFVHTGLARLSKAERLALVKVLLLRFAELHELNVAHRDVASHSLWVDQPARIIVSGFPAAYVPEFQTVGGYADRIRVARDVLPEDDASSEGGTPYSRDVFMLGLQAHLLLYGELPPRDGKSHRWLARPEDKYGTDVEHVLEKALQKSPAARYATARHMLDAFNACGTIATPNRITRSQFESFRAGMRPQELPEDHVFIDRDDLSFYRSKAHGKDLSVKIWHGAEISTDDYEAGLRLLSFLERGRTLRVAEVGGVARILECGLTKRSLLVVTEWADGVALDEWLSTPQSLAVRIAVATSLVDTVERLHARSIAHGDVHPRNIIINAGGHVTLVDLLDFAVGGHDRYTTVYLPADFARLSPLDRDCYGTARVVQDLLSGGANANAKATHSPDAVLTEAARIQERPDGATLSALLEALDAAAVPGTTAAPRFTVPAREDTGRVAAARDLVSDNGSFHVEVQKSRQFADALFFRVTGVSGALEFDFHPADGMKGDVRLRIVQPWQLARVQHRAIVSLPMEISIRGTYDNPQVVAQLATHLLDQPELRTAQFGPGSYVDIDASEGDDTDEREDTTQSATGFVRPSAAFLWQAILDAEESVLTTLTVRGAVESMGGGKPIARVPCYLESGDVDEEPDEQVEVEHQDQNGEWRRCGYLNFEESCLQEPYLLALDQPRRTRDIRVGDTLRLRSALERLSFARRSDAVSRITKGRAVVGNLLNYFEPGSARVAEPRLFPEPSTEELQPYAVGLRALNDSQMSAMQRVLTTGPLSLVQGPPGTGKTQFIASLLHALITKRGARKILVVSQSHEAVNNVLEKADDLFRLHGDTLDVVRLGHEDHASDAVRAFHVDAIQRSYRDVFRAELEDRVAILVSGLGLPAEYVSKMVGLWSHLGALAERVEEFERQESSEQTEEWRVRIHAQAQRARDLFFDRAFREYGAPATGEPRGLLSNLESTWTREHHVDSPDAVARLRKAYRLACDWVEALGSKDSNFAEFQAKTRCIVADTLVGIGRRASGVVQNEHEWVIVDEAGRAAPSELAVAIQAGQRILLVGDHKQLPPTFSDEVKDALEARFPGMAERLLEESEFHALFESEYGNKAGAGLWDQYRMAPAICDVVSNCFYGGKLQTARGPVHDCYKRLPDFCSHEVTWLDTCDMGAASLESRRGRGDICNELEAQAVMHLLRAIVQAEGFVAEWTSLLKPAEQGIGIVCMYSEQRRLIEKLCLEATWLSELRPRVKIDTVDGYQGKENHIVIVTTVRHNADKKVGFVKSPHRVNVALSRAMDRLFVVGAANMWTGSNASLPLGQALAVIRQLEQQGRASLMPLKGLFSEWTTSV